MTTASPGGANYYFNISRTLSELLLKNGSFINFSTKALRGKKSMPIFKQPNKGKLPVSSLSHHFSFKSNNKTTDLNDSKRCFFNSIVSAIEHSYMLAFTILPEIGSWPY